MQSDWMLTPEDYKKIDCPTNDCTRCPENIYGEDYCGFEVKVANAQAVKLLQHLIDTARKSKLPPLQKDSVTLANFIVMMEAMLKDIQEANHD